MPATGPRPYVGETVEGEGSALRVEILGPVRLWRDGVELDLGPRQQRCVLAMLLAHEGRPVSTSDLIGLIWDADAPASALNVIHKYVGALRRLLEPALLARGAGSYLQRHSSGYLFAAGPGMLDLTLFRENVLAARLAQRPEEALEHYVAALRLWHGPAGDALIYGSTATPIFAALDSEFYDACVAAAELAIAQRQPERVLPALWLAASMTPLHEPVQAALVVTMGAAGQQAEALAVFRAVRDRLVDELGIDPGQALQQAHLRVLSQSVPGDEQPEVAPEPLARPAQLPPDLPTFVGRDDELAALGKLFSVGGRTSPLIVAMDGMGGVGKSTLAAHFAYGVADGFTDGQLYLDLRGHASEEESLPAAEALRSLLASLGVRESVIPESFNARVGAYRSLTAGKKYLVLLDNVRDVAQVRPLLPNSAASLVLVTSRQPLVGLAALDGAHLLHVDLPDPASALALLWRRLERSPNRCAVDVVDEDALGEIVALCGRLPLALAIIAGRLSARPRLSPAAVAAELRDGAQKLAAFPGGLGVSDPRTAFAWSYRQLSPRAARLFRLFSLTVSAGVSAQACASLAGEAPQEARALLAELIEAALLDEDDRGHYSSHVLVKAYAEELFHAEESAAQRAAAITRLLQHYLHSSFNAAEVLAPRRRPIEPPPPLLGVVAERPGSYDDALRWFDQHRDVLHEAVRSAAEVGFAIAPWQLALTMQPSLQWSGRFQDWQDVMQISLRAAVERGDRVGEAHTLRSLAGARHAFGAIEETVELLSAAQKIFTEYGMLLEQGFVHMNLHVTYSELGRHERALAESERAMALYHEAGNERAEVWALEARGISQLRLGAFEEARQSLEEALALNQRLGNKTDEPDIRIFMSQCLIKLGRPAEGVAQLEQALRAAAGTKNKVDSFQAAIQLSDALLLLGDVPGSSRAWRLACDTMHAMQNGGTSDMRDAVDEVGAKLVEINTQRA